MREKPVLDVSEAYAATRAVLDAAFATGCQRVACAVVDDAGDLLSFAALDAASPLARERAVKKAYTAAKAQRDLAELSASTDVSQLGDANFVSSAGGGLVIRDATEGSVLGALGVSGGRAEEDELFAGTGLAAIQARRSERSAGPRRWVLGADQAVAIVQAMIDTAIANRHETTPPRRPAAVIVLDHHGDVLASACMAGANPAMARQNAFKKAYTAVCMRSDTAALEQHLKGLGRSVRDFPNPNFSGGPGGLVLRSPTDGVVVGGIGVSGRSGEEDQIVALAGLRAFDGIGEYTAFVSPDMRL